MKNSIKSVKLKLALSLILTVFATVSTKSQTVNTPYEIQNNTNCNIVVSWEVYNNSCTSCYGPTLVTIPANQSYFIYSFPSPCTSSNSGCNLIINITNIGGTVGPWGPYDNSTSNPVSIGAVGTCVTGSGTFVWGQSISALNP